MTNNHFQRYDQIGLAADWRGDAERYADEMETRFRFDRPDRVTAAITTRGAARHFVMGVLRTSGAGPVASSSIIAAAKAAGHNRDAVARVMDRLSDEGVVQRVGRAKLDGRHCTLWQIASPGA